VEARHGKKHMIDHELSEGAPNVLAADYANRLGSGAISEKDTLHYFKNRLRWVDPRTPMSKMPDC